jgi:hypothetical protein
MWRRSPYFDVVPYGHVDSIADRTFACRSAGCSISHDRSDPRGVGGPRRGGQRRWASHFGWNRLTGVLGGPVSIWGSVDEVAQAENTGAALERASRRGPGWV